METNNTARIQAATNQYADGEIDLLELAGVVFNRILYVILAFVIGAVLFFGGTKLLITPQYEATSTIYIFSKTTSITSLADLQIGSQLAQDFQIIATTRNVVESVIDELNLDTDYETLVKRITVTNPTQSHMLKVAVRDPDPEVAANVSNVLSDRLRDQIADIMNTDKPSVVQQAVVPAHPVSPSTVKNTAIGALLGALLAIAYIVITYMLDDTIKTSDDIKKYMELDTLAEFPLIRHSGKTGSTKSTKSSGGSSRKTGSGSASSSTRRSRHDAK